MPQFLPELDSQTPKPAIKVAFFDIDGTLLDSAGHYTASLKNELSRIRALGVRTAIASGRPHFAARFLMDELGLDAPGVFCSGAQIYSPSVKQTLCCAAMPVGPNRRLLARLREIPVYYELYGLNDFYIETTFAPEVRETHAHHLRRRAVEGALDAVVERESVLKWVLGLRKDAPEDLLGVLEREFPELTFSYAAFPACPEWRFVNVIAREACKDKAFTWLLKYYQVEAAQVASFGDSHSDETFLRLAGCGVAMGNAADDVKAVARFVTKPAWEDGVAYALARLI